jgi:hypothetical protein
LEFFESIFRTEKEVLYFIKNITKSGDITKTNLSILAFRNWNVQKLKQKQCGMKIKKKTKKKNTNL